MCRQTPFPRLTFGKFSRHPLVPPAGSTLPTCQHGPPWHSPPYVPGPHYSSTVGALPSLPEGSGAPASLPQHIHSHYPCLLFLQGIQHPRFHCLAYAGWPKPSSMKAYSTTHAGSITVKQRMFWTFCAQYQLMAFPALEDMLMVFATYLDDHLHRCYATIHHFMAAIHVQCTYSLGSSQPPGELTPSTAVALGNLPLHHPQPQPDLGQLGITTEFLQWARPLHWLHNTRDSVLWAALTIGHYGLFCSGKLAQPKLAEAGVAWFIRVQDITPHFMQGCLHFVCIHLSGSKTDPFQLGCPVIIGCTGTAVCGALQGLAHHPVA